MHDAQGVAGCARMLKASPSLASFCLARDGRIRSASPAAVEMLGAPLGPDATLEEVLHLDPDSMAALLAATTWEGTGALLRGEQLPVAVGLNAFGTDDEVLLLLTVKLGPLLEMQESFDDITSQLTNMNRERAKQGVKLTRALNELETQKRELEVTLAKLDAANRELQDLDRLKTRFYANMSHELRTPLNSILGFAEDALEGRAGPLSEDLTQYFQTIHNSGTRQLALISAILDLASLQAGRMTLNVTGFPIGELLVDLQATMRPLVARKQQTLDVAVSGDPVVHADKDKTFQILLNLVSNAHKYTPDGGHLAIRAAVEGDRLRVSVQDDGVGIPPEDLADLFQEFHRVKGSSHGQQGTGLGLAITKRLVEMQGGTIAVESTLGQGSIFRFTLPLASAITA
ncbi:Non-motile and phage-resistance protein [compost metagenome]